MVSFESVPVLIIGYRRPDLVAEVMRAVAEVKPNRLFLACDGAHPSRPAEIELVEATRRTMETAITWPCVVERLYHDTNQGCRKGVVSAIDWFFSNVEAGIILEDDCVPHPDFFPYCAELLSRYATTSQVMHISGDGGLAVLGRQRSESYVFTREVLVWGWATWRRAWSCYDRDLKRWAEIRQNQVAVQALFGSQRAAAHWTRILDRLLIEDLPDTWDYQWTFTVRECNGVGVAPTRNLITNIGYRGDATHTTSEEGPRSNVPSQALRAMVHPSRVAIDDELDQAIQNELRGFLAVKRKKTKWRRLLRRLRRIRGRLASLGTINP